MAASPWRNSARAARLHVWQRRAIASERRDVRVSGENSLKSTTSAAACAAIASMCATGVLLAQDRGFPRLETSDPACQTARLVSTGGAFPRDRHTLAIRWTGYSNFELAYDGQVVLLDAYFDRGSIYPPLGFKAADVVKADVILIGHGHFDHMSDAASVGARTGAVVVGAPLTIDKLRTQPIDARQLRTVTGRGGETLQFRGFTVEPILGRHGEPPDAVTAAFNRAIQSVTTPPTAEQAAEQAAIRALGTSDRRVTTEGTIAYLMTLDTGFRILYRDSGGRVTDYERAALQRVGRVDVALVATSAAYLSNLTVQQALEYVRTYHPAVYMPAHHDAPSNSLWRATEPLFQAIKDENPDIMTISKEYREPACFNTENAQGRRG
jgi:L-ascorbate metabolism protein UlaG (beta-lactamase superfamily)